MDNTTQKLVETVNKIVSKQPATPIQLNEIGVPARPVFTVGGGALLGAYSAAKEKLKDKSFYDIATSPSDIAGAILAGAGQGALWGGAVEAGLYPRVRQAVRSVADTMTDLSVKALEAGLPPTARQIGKGAGILTQTAKEGINILKPTPPEPQIGVDTPKSPASKTTAPKIEIKPGESISLRAPGDQIDIDTLRALQTTAGIDRNDPKWQEAYDKATSRAQSGKPTTKFKTPTGILEITFGTDSANRITPHSAVFTPHTPSTPTPVAKPIKSGGIEINPKEPNIKPKSGRPGMAGVGPVLGIVGGEVVGTALKSPLDPVAQYIADLISPTRKQIPASEVLQGVPYTPPARRSGINEEIYINILKQMFVKEEASLDGPSPQLHPDIVKELIRQGYHHPVHNPIKRSSSTSGRGYFVQENPSMDSRSFPDARIVDPKTGRITLHPSYEGWTRLSGPYSGD